MSGVRVPPPLPPKERFQASSSTRAPFFVPAPFFRPTKTTAWPTAHGSPLAIFNPLRHRARRDTCRTLRGGVGCESVRQFALRPPRRERTSRPGQDAGAGSKRDSARKRGRLVERAVLGAGSRRIFIGSVTDQATWRAAAAPRSPAGTAAPPQAPALPATRPARRYGGFSPSGCSRQNAAPPGAAARPCGCGGPRCPPSRRVMASP